MVPMEVSKLKPGDRVKVNKNHPRYRNGFSCAKAPRKVCKTCKLSVFNIDNSIFCVRDLVRMRIVFTFKYPCVSNMNFSVPVGDIEGSDFLIKQYEWKKL